MGHGNSLLIGILNLVNWTYRLKILRFVKYFFFVNQHSLCSTFSILTLAAATVLCSVCFKTSINTISLFSFLLFWHFLFTPLNPCVISRLIPYNQRAIHTVLYAHVLINCSTALLYCRVHNPSTTYRKYSSQWCQILTKFWCQISKQKEPEFLVKLVY